MVPADDPKALLTTFKQVVETYQWPQDKRIVKVAPLLTGEAQVTYQALWADVAQDYKTPKVAMLDWLGLTEEAYCHRFRIETWDPNIQAQALAPKLKDLSTHCLYPDLWSAGEIVELMTLGQFCVVLPVKTWRWVYCLGRCGYPGRRGQLGGSHPETGRLHEDGGRLLGEPVTFWPKEARSLGKTTLSQFPLRPHPRRGPWSDPSREVSHFSHPLQPRRRKRDSNNMFLVQEERPSILGLSTDRLLVHLCLCF